MFLVVEQLASEIADDRNHCQSCQQFCPRMKTVDGNQSQHRHDWEDDTQDHHLAKRPSQDEYYCCQYKGAHSDRVSVYQHGVVHPFRRAAF